MCGLGRSRTDDIPRRAHVLPLEPVELCISTTSSTRLRRGTNVRVGLTWERGHDVLKREPCEDALRRRLGDPPSRWSLLECHPLPGALETLHSKVCGLVRERVGCASQHLIGARRRHQHPHFAGGRRPSLSAGLRLRATSSSLYGM